MAETNMQAAVDVVIKDPVGSVKKAMTPAGREFYALSALTMTVQTPTLWPQLRDSGILNVFIELLVDEWTSPEVEAVSLPLQRNMLISSFFLTFSIGRLSRQLQDGYLP